MLVTIMVGHLQKLTALLVMLTLVPVCLLALVSLSSQQCLTPEDSVRKMSESAAENLLQSELRFSTDLLHAVSSMHPDQNVIFSPTSVFKALLLAYFISANTTENSLKRALHLAPNEDKLDIMGAYTAQIYSEKLRSIPAEYELTSANRMYVERTMPIKPCMKTLFVEEIFKVNFKRNPKVVVQNINRWVSDRTRKVINNFLSSDQVSPNTRLILVNAAYFKGDWKYKFDINDTYEEFFTPTNGIKVKTPMMTQESEFKLIYNEGLDAVVVELPYKGDAISMLVVKPNTPTPSAVPELVKKITFESLQGLAKILNSIEPDSRTVTIPKFTVEKTLKLNEILESIGVGDLFQKSANFSTLVGGNETISFSEATHKAKVQVNEEGTEAAAATAFLGFRMGGANNFIADTPFIYILYDKMNNVILFFGIYNHPEKNV